MHACSRSPYSRISCSLVRSCGVSTVGGQKEAVPDSLRGVPLGCRVATCRVVEGVGHGGQSTKKGIPAAVCLSLRVVLTDGGTPALLDARVDLRKTEGSVSTKEGLVDGFSATSVGAVLDSMYLIAQGERQEPHHRMVSQKMGLCLGVSCLEHFFRFSSSLRLPLFFIVCIST